MTCPRLHHPESCSTRHLGPPGRWTLSKGLNMTCTRSNLCTSVFPNSRLNGECMGVTGSLRDAAASQLPVCVCVLLPLSVLSVHPYALSSLPRKFSYGPLYGSRSLQCSIPLGPLFCAEYHPTLQSSCQARSTILFPSCYG